MFTKKSTEPSELDKLIVKLVSEMDEVKIDGEEFAKMTDQLIKLYKLKAETTPKRVSADTWALIGANLAGIVLILGHERANVIATKALGFVSKLK